MGKRELLLIIGFVAAGVLIYQATAPPSTADGAGRSIGRIIDHVRREVRGRTAAAEATRTSVHALDSDVTELWLQGIRGQVGEIQVVGEDRPDVEAALRVLSRGYDEAEARGTLDRTALETDRVGAALAVSIRFPPEGRQTAWLTLKVPSRLRVRVDARPGTLRVSGVGALQATSAGGETTIRKVAGDVDVTHRGGAIAIGEAAAVRFTGRNSRLTLGPVNGDVVLRMEGGGAAQLSGVAGAVEVDGRNADIVLQDLSRTRGPVGVNATGGSIRLDRLASEARLDIRNAELDVTMSAAAPVTIITEGTDVALTPPDAGCELDVAVTDGRIRPDTAIAALRLERTGAGEKGEQRASGTLHGGGPTISVRARRGDVILRVPSEAR